MHHWEWISKVHFTELLNFTPCIVCKTYTKSGEEVVILATTDRSCKIKMSRDTSQCSPTRDSCRPACCCFHWLAPCCKYWAGAHTPLIENLSEACVSCSVWEWLSLQSISPLAGPKCEDPWSEDPSRCVRRIERSLWCFSWRNLRPAACRQHGPQHPKRNTPTRINTSWMVLLLCRVLAA